MSILLKSIHYNCISQYCSSFACFLSRSKITKPLLISFSIIGLVLTNPVTAATTDPYIEIETGIIKGQAIVDSSGNETGTYAFKGIPYAKPPVGRLRWQPPQAAEAWNGVRETTQFGPSCIQPKNDMVVVPGAKSEDCLTLNVWTASKRGDNRPVMVWIHGGGFSIGGSSQAVHNGQSFAESGAVLVNINYRLGPFGFMAHPALSAETQTNISGNYGIMDQVAALRWVQRNIAAFGGNPENVTIFGESAGGISVAALLVTPLAEGLFHRAIMESGSMEITTALRSNNSGSPSGETLGVKIATKLGIADPADSSEVTAAALRARSAEDVLAAAAPRVGLFGKGNKLFPVIDGHVFPHTFEDTVTLGEHNNVPIILGLNADEGTFYLEQIYNQFPIETQSQYEYFVRLLFEDDAPQVLDMFPGSSASDFKSAIADIITVATFAAPARRTARLLSRHGTPVWMYHFTRVADYPGAEELGATHGREVFYVFKTLPWYIEANVRDKTVSQTMHATWYNFASTGNPNRTGLPVWPRYFPTPDWHMEFGDEFKVGSQLWREACDMFDEIYYPK